MDKGAKGAPVKQRTCSPVDTDNKKDDVTVELREQMAAQMFDAGIALDRVAEVLEGSDGMLKLMVCACVVRGVMNGKSIGAALRIVWAIMSMMDEDPSLVPSAEKSQAHMKRK